MEDVLDVASSTELQVHSWLYTCMTIGQIERKWSLFLNSRLRLQLLSWHRGCYWCSKFNWVTSTFMVKFMYDHRLNGMKMKPALELSTSVGTAFMACKYDHRIDRTQWIRSADCKKTSILLGKSHCTENVVNRKNRFQMNFRAFIVKIMHFFIKDRKIFIAWCATTFKLTVIIILVSVVC